MRWGGRQGGEGDEDGKGGFDEESSGAGEDVIDASEFKFCVIEIAGLAPP